MRFFNWHRHADTAPATPQIVIDAEKLRKFLVEKKISGRVDLKKKIITIHLGQYSAENRKSLDDFVFEEMPNRDITIQPDKLIPPSK